MGSAGKTAACAVLFYLLVSLSGFAAELGGSPVALSDSVLPQGGIVRVAVADEAGLDTVTGTFLKNSLPFIPSSDGGFYTMAGADMETTPGEYGLSLKLVRRDGSSQNVSRRLRVVDGKFPVQELTLPPAQVFPDSAAAARIEREDELRNRRWRQWARSAFWGKRFIVPVEGEMDRFGHRRVINGAPRSPHTGVDISSPEGTPVLAPAAGRVILTGDFFFTGNSIYIDHGLGLISMLFHLSRIDVQEGDTVEQGQVIGAVGSTGRVTGPHLHWGVRWRGARINPASLLKLELE
ncbi:MAG TPA: M23 family metallopeptidase [Candidatus Glassbacteria bacterium]|nr:M23 family metallopeptidase [Candidatus Glassbacteria bacterium]